MRNSERISQVMTALTEIWCRYPDLRFNQLIESLQIEYNNTHDSIYSREYWEKDEYNGIVSYRRWIRPDLFNLEDESFLSFLQIKLNNINRGE